MTLADILTTAFALLNGGRIIAYLPQVVRICRDPNDAAAVSVLTWSIFLAANIGTVVYAIFVSADAVVATVFSFNVLGCLSIIATTFYKRLARTRDGSRPSAAERPVMSSGHDGSAVLLRPE